MKNRKQELVHVMYCGQCYEELEIRLEGMEDLERAVAQHITLPWLRGDMKELDENAMDQAFMRVLKELGNVTWDDVALEAHRQENWY